MHLQEKILTSMQTHNIIVLNMQMQRGGKQLKRVGIIMDDELHKRLKHLAVNEGKTVTDIIVELVKAEVEAKKEQSR